MKKKLITSLLLAGILTFSVPVSAATMTTVLINSNLKLNTGDFWLMQCGVNKTKQLKATNAKGKVTWGTSDPSVAKVDSNGLVTAVGTGGAYSKSCYIVANNGGNTASVKVKVFSFKSIKSVYSKNGVTIRLYEGLMNNDDCGKARYYAAHVSLTSAAYNKMHIAKAKGARSAGFQTIKEMVKTNNNKAYNAILAVNGPFNGKDSTKWNCFASDGKNYSTSGHNFREIYGGTYSGGTKGDLTVSDHATYSAKTGYLRPGTSQSGITKGMALSTAASKKLISDTLHGDMGSTLLSGGTVKGKKSSSYAQRTFIGTNGKPGDFWIVVCNGRNTDSYSKGLNEYGEGEILRRLGCTYGYSLDGGGSSTMIYNGEVINKQKELRRCYDALYIAR